jgi:HlyD family secretion protein
MAIASVRKKPKITTARLIVAGIVALGLGLGGWMLFKPKAEESPYRTAEVTRGDVTSSVSASGKLQALVTVDVGSQISGQIQDIYVDFNDRVTRGQLLAVIDPQTFTSRVQQGRAQVAASTANRNQVQAQARVAAANYNRTRQLFEKGFVSQAQLDADLASYQAAQAQIASATAQIGQSQASLAATQADLTRTRITSPIDGIVIDRRVEPGNTVAASLNAPVLFTIAQDLSNLEVQISVGEADIGQLREGQNVNFTVDAFPDDTFRGVVTQVRKQPTTESNVTAYLVIAEAQNPDSKLLPGMTANADIVLQERRNVLQVPATALRWKPADQQPAARPTGGAGFGGPGAGGGGFGPPGGGGGFGPPGGGGQGGAGGGQRGAGGGAMLAQLGLDADTLKKAQAIMSEARQKALSEAGGDRAKMRAAMQKANQDAFAKIEPLLNAKQKAQFAQIRAVMAQGGRGGAGAGAGAGGMTPGVVYVLRDGEPVAVNVMVGGTDGTSTEITGDIREGDLVITGGGPRPPVQARSLLGGAPGAGAGPQRQP